MPKLNLRSFENQAMISVALAGAAGLCAIAGVFSVLYRFNWQDFILTYNSRGLRIVLIAGSLFLALSGSVVGFCVAFNSAGRRRNKKSRLSWIGFFLNAAILAVTLMASFFFLFTRNPTAVG